MGGPDMDKHGVKCAEDMREKSHDRNISMVYMACLAQRSRMFQEINRAKHFRKYVVEVIA